MTDSSNYDRFLAAYQGDVPPPWDSGIVPPEVRALVESDTPLEPGRALDVGCGTGMSSVYLALHGWQVTGVDWVQQALERARHRARQADRPADNPRFVRADAGSADFLPDQTPVSLWLDVGCLHSFSPEARQHYAHHAARLVAPGGTLLLYAFAPHERDGQPRGLSPDEVAARFAPAFAVVSVQHGQEVTDPVTASAWYWLRRV
ncbi:MAG: class I SAM-dependent methyltransferase [Chloroflexi bacterium]|nr:class I SAM-dependent methyltransferase [Chloroflexota bacterium]